MPSPSSGLVHRAFPIQLMRQRDRAHKIAKRSGSQNNWDVYKKLRNSVTEQIRSKKSEHFTSTIEENKGNSSVMWKKLKEVLPNKHKIVANSLLSQHGEVVDDLADIADIFNVHFSTVGERLVSNATPCGLVDDNIHLTRINSLDVKCTLPNSSMFKSKYHQCRSGRQLVRMEKV